MRVYAHASVSALRVCFVCMLRMFVCVCVCARARTCIRAVCACARIRVCFGQYA